MKMRLERWGESLAIRLPDDIVADSAMDENTDVELDLRDGTIVVRRVKPRYTFDELVNAITPENRHDEISWGASIGRETIE